MLKSASGIRRSIGSRASLVSLASTSSLSCSSNERAASSRSFGGRSRGTHARISSSSSLNLSSIATASCQQQQAFAGWSREKNSNRRATCTVQAERVLPVDQGNCLLYTFLSVVFFRATRHILRFIDLFRADTIHVLDLLKAMLLCYRNEYCLKQYFAAFALASTSSLSSSKGQMMSGSGFAGSNRSQGLMPCYSSEEFEPKARLIVPAETIAADGDEDMGGHWGHFADFDVIEDHVFVPAPLSDRFQLETLDESENEDEH